MRYMMLLVLIISAFGCGGGSGVDGSLYIDALSADDLMKLCQYGLDQQGAAGMKDCGNGVTVTVKSVAECTMDAQRPHCQVSVLEDCFESISGDACKIFSSSTCATYIQCATSGG